MMMDRVTHIINAATEYTLCGKETDESSEFTVDTVGADCDKCLQGWPNFLDAHGSEVA